MKKMKKIDKIRDRDEFTGLDYEMSFFPPRKDKYPSLTTRNLKIIVDKLNELTIVLNELIDVHNAPLHGGHDVDEFYKD